MKKTLLYLAIAFASLGNFQAQDGSLDLNFNANGVGSSQTPGAVEVQADGKLLLGASTAGAYTYNGVTTKRLFRLNSDGSNDNTFAGYGTNNNIIISAIKYLSDNKILIADASSTTSRIVRVNTNGSIDASFNDPKKLWWSTYERVYSIVPHYGDKLLVGGNFSGYQPVAGSNKYSYLVRLDENGSMDNTFNAGGFGPNSTINAIAITTNNKVYIGGSFSKYNSTNISCIARLEKDGTLDNTFNIGGSGTDGQVRSIFVQTDGKIVLAGDFNKFNGIEARNIIRLNSNGTLDLTFNSDALESSTSGNVAVNKVTVLADGKLLFSGRFDKSGTVLTGSIGRLNSDGTLDTTFNPTGNGAKILVGNVFNNSNLTQLNLQPDGKILIAGDFNNYNSNGTKKLFHRLTGNTLPSTLGFSIIKDASINFKIAPNPSTGIFTVKSAENIKSIEIYDATGKLIKQLKGLGKEMEVNLTPVQKGIYYIKMNSSILQSDKGQKLILK